MQFAMNQLDPATRYKLLVNTITPRPIAWVLTRDGEGSNNAAPYSFFNAMGGSPPLVAIGMAADGQRAGVEVKDSLANIRASGEFAVALVSEGQAEAMNVTAVDSPAGVDELALAGLEALDAAQVDAPLIAGAPVQFECKVWKIVETGAHSAIVIGEVIVSHIDDAFVGEEDGKLRIDNPAMKLVGRTYAAGEYVKTDSPLHMDRLSWKDLSGD